VEKGLPFRQAHDVVGGLVRRAEERGVELDALPADQVRAASPLLDPDDPAFRARFDVARAVERRDVPGGPARARVAAEIARVRAELGASTAVPAPRPEGSAPGDEEAKP
jgi:argininosuccinate lyase